MVATEFQQLIDTFPSSPFGVSRVIRKLQEEAPDEFRRLAFEHMRSGLDSPGGRYVATLLSIRHDGVPSGELADPSAMELSTAIRVARAVQSHDPLFEHRLLDYLVETPMPLTHQSRILDILDAVASGPKLLGAFRRIARTAEPALVSKFAMVAARRDPNREWFEARLHEPDARVRANVVEALWGHKDAKSLDVLQAALIDSNCRVIANAAVGLYLASEVCALAALHQLLGSPDQARRLSGIWAAGFVEDPRFDAKLREFAQEGSGTRYRILARQSLAKILQRESARTGVLTLKINTVQRDASGRFLVPFAVTDAGAPRNQSSPSPTTGVGVNPDTTIAEQTTGTPVGEIGALEFMPFEDGQPLLHYTVAENVPNSGLYLLTATPLTNPTGDERMVQITIAVSCDRGKGEQSSFWFRS